MVVVAKMLSKQDMADLAAFYADQPLPCPSGLPKPYSGPIRQDRNQSNLSWSVRLSRNCMALPHSC
jgi:hypothetical protein